MVPLFGAYDMSKVGGGYNANEFCIDPMSAHYRVPTHSGDGYNSGVQIPFWSLFCDQTTPAFSWLDNCEEEQRLCLLFLPDMLMARFVELRDV